MRQFNEFEIKNFTLISNLGIKYTTFQTYWTSLDKRYFDAIAPIRVFFKEEGIHDYASQGQGQINKEYREAYLLTNNLMIPAKASLYRPTTKKGDPRLWFSRLSKTSFSLNSKSFPVWVFIRTVSACFFSFTSVTI